MGQFATTNPKTKKAPLQGLRLRSLLAS